MAKNKFWKHHFSSVDVDELWLQATSRQSKAHALSVPLRGFNVCKPQ
jgi:hypothetical protein